MYFCVHVNPKGGRRAPALRAEYGVRPACRVCWPCRSFNRVCTCRSLPCILPEELGQADPFRRSPVGRCNYFCRPAA